MPIRISGSTGISGLDGSASAPVYAGANTNVGLFVSGNTVNVSATNLSVGNTVVSNSGVSVGGIAVSQYSGMMKNRIINGDFRIDQRFAGAANNNIAANQYVVDRWWNFASAAAKLRYQQNNINGPGSAATQIATGFPNYFGANVVSSNTVNNHDYWALAQTIEGHNISDLGWGTANAPPVTLSFWSYSSVPGTHGGTIAAPGDNSSYPFTYTINTANTWQYQTITIPGPTSGGSTTWYTNNSIGMTVYFSLGVGSAYSRSNTFTWGAAGQQWPTGTVNVVSNANGSFYLTGVQLEKGSQATAFDFRHYTTELQLCQRYFQKSYNPDIAVGTATSTGNTGYIEWNWGTMTTNATVTVFMKQTMRDSPTFTTYRIGDGTINGFAYWNGSTTVQATGTLSGFGRGANIVTWFMDGTSRSNMQFHWMASAELGVQN